MEKLETAKNTLLLMQKLVRNDLKSRYSGSVFGVVWAYVQPLVTILVFWYVFQVGFRNPPVDNVAYILWFIAGYIPWTFFNDGLMSCANVFYEYSYLVKKMKFKVWTLPLVKVLSSLYIHAFFLVFIIGIYFLYGYSFRLAWLSIFYYSFCVMVLLAGNAYLLSSLSVFFKDASQLVSVLLQILFWLTPIFWSDESMTDSVLAVLKCNPLYYIISGYRDALIDGVGFWQQPLGATLYFWAFALVLAAVGVKTYHRLKVHFADLL